MNPTRLTVRPADWIPDWYVIEWAEHDGREWLEKTGPNSVSLRRSARVSDADVEGTASEMLALADAIDQGASFYARRCAVRPVRGGFALHSPRNSLTEAVVSRDAAVDLAATIRRVCGPVDLNGGDGPNGSEP